MKITFYRLQKTEKCYYIQIKALRHSPSCSSKLPIAVQSIPQRVYPTTSVTLAGDISRNGVHPSRDGQTLCTFIQASKQAFISVLTLTFLFKPLWPIQQKQGHKGSFPISAPTWQMGYLTLSSANWKHTVRNGLAQVKHQSVFHSSLSIISVCLTPCKNK